MRIAIVGAGFVGLSCAYRLSQKGHEITLFDKEDFPGGLAIGYRRKNWDWSLEKFYHHWFINDKSILSLAKKIDYEVIEKRPKTSVFLKDSIFQLDSILNVIQFPPLSVLERIRMGAVIAFLKYNPFWKSLEHFRTSSFLKKGVGKNPYQKIWEPQLKNKFGDFSDNISLAWFWARIKKRTASLAYPKKGFLEFAKKIADEIKEKEGRIILKTEVVEIDEKGKLTAKIKDEEIKEYTFDRIIFTLPSFSFTKIVKNLDNEYRNKLLNLKGLGAVNLVLRLRQPLLRDGTYWLSVCEKNSPLMAIVEHTNFMDKKYYGNEHIVYLGNYIDQNHPYMKMEKDEILKRFDPFLKRINPQYTSSIIGFDLFKAPFAQPIIPPNYSEIIPLFETPVKNLFLANMQQVYPWDRGTNYAVELGEKIADIVDD